MNHHVVLRHQAPQLGRILLGLLFTFALSATVTVADVAAAVQLASPATGETIQNVGDLPLATRNFFSLLALSAGANTEMADTAALGRGSVSINVNGQRPVNNNFQLEGINAN